LCYSLQWYFLYGFLVDEGNMDIITTGQITMAMLTFWLYVIPILLAAFLTRKLIFD